MKWLLVVLSLVGFNAFAESKPVSFSKAKKNMYKKVFNNSGHTLYCGCDWSKKKVDLKSCGLQSYFPKKQRKRASRTEAEHIIPASWMLKKNKRFRQCAIDAKGSGKSKRDYCRDHDMEYKQAHNDLVNLYPSVGQINADRSNKPFLDEVTRATDKYGKCPAMTSKRGFVPPKDKKGDIARIAFYMSKKYGVTYSTRQVRLFKRWNEIDPVSPEEIRHHQRIIKAQGYGMSLSSN